MLGGAQTRLRSKRILHCSQSAVTSRRRHPPAHQTRQRLSQLRRNFMIKDQFKGAVKEADGNVQEQTGKAIGDTDQQVRGLVKQAESPVQKAYGDVKESLSNPQVPNAGTGA
jgi:uncharacterized protein YjbJ (UPF0337 family)